jgi:hypothetical protein
VHTHSFSNFATDTVEQLQASLLQGLSVYYTTLNSTVDFFDYFTSSSMDGSFEPPVLTISTYKIGASIFDLSQPFDDSILQSTPGCFATLCLCSFVF